MFVLSCASFITAYINFKTDIEAELVSILESNILVETAEVSVTDIEENDFSRQKRMIEPSQVKTRPIIIHFVSVCYVHLENIIDMDSIEVSLMKSITSLETFLSSEGSINAVQPKVIEIAPIFSGKSGQKSSCILNFDLIFHCLRNKVHFQKDWKQLFNNQIKPILKIFIKMRFLMSQNVTDRIIGQIGIVWTIR